ncbi:helix-turn-helix domain-containing protein [Cellulomonas cellasea]|uniref:winged helix-turn-helix domain-containing protein n=1 Tax=Cellulomonas cellasea TaxID=43670 RepID=UPI0025A40B52|nr:helix-turn-helix domain-containing protein [Cellulomonas cellasea]MDM8085922.1 helix-turn-helix domain-containing protein [Cellulomonas cellasea]
MDERTTPQARTSDPERIRALTHPVRIAILELIDARRQATATECAEALDETVANCSFHLRTLERYGFVERAEPIGRLRPWRRTVSSPRSFGVDPDRAGADPASTHAVVELAAMTASRDADRFIASMRAEAERYTSGDRDTDPGPSLLKTMAWVTPEEADELVEQLGQIGEAFRARRDDPALRPPGARLWNIVSMASPDPGGPASEPSPEEG